MSRIYTILFLLAISGIGFASYHFAYQRFEQGARKTSEERLSLYRASLRSTLERVGHLPHVVSLHPFTKEVLRQGKSIASFNAYLKSVNDQAGSAALYLLDRDATTIAASNYDNEESFVGNNYRFRKYYLDALREGKGNYFAVGVTTNRPGYFQSEVISDEAGPLGVAVVKVEFRELLQDWHDAAETVLISNQDGVVVLASNAGHLYRTLREIPAYRLEEIRAGRQFFGFELERLDFQSENDAFSDNVTLNRKKYVVTTADIKSLGWKLHFLAPLEPVANSALAISIVTILIGGIAGIGILYARSKVERGKLQIVAVEAERVRKANMRLELEIAERKRTEEQLRETQAELIQSSRLAALGKMSAAIVHEVNQPVSAIRTYTSSGLLLLKNRRIKDAREVLAQIAKMTERLGAITSDLLVFSRKPVAQPQRVGVNQCIREILEERLPAARDAGVEVAHDLWQRELVVIGSKHRFEQLIGNLLQNAVQACEGREGSVVSVTTIADPTSAVIMVSDNGAGISDEVKDQLFDPFFTTKSVGKGIGLGLALCYAIVEEAGGRIRGDNRKEGGARFVVELPLASAHLRYIEKEQVDG